MTDFLHGVEVVEIADGLRPIRTVKSAVIGLVGSAPKGPINTPTLIAGSRTKGTEVFGAGVGTIPDALDAIFRQTGAAVVVVNVLDPASYKTAVPEKLFQLTDGSVTLPHRYASSLVVKSAPVATDALEAATDYTVVLDTGVLTRVSTSAKWDETTTKVIVEYSNGGVRYREEVAVTAGAGSTATVANRTDGIELHNAWAKPAAGVAEVTRAPSQYAYNADTGVLSRVGIDIDTDEWLNVVYDRPDETEISATEIVGGVDAGTGAYTGVSALLGAQSAVGQTPKILIAPGYSEIDGVADALITAADRLRAVAPIEGPSVTDDDAISYRGNFGSRRAYLVDPNVQIADPDGGADPVEAPNSAYVAGVIARSDAERGFWWSPSNREIRGIVGTVRPIDFSLGDPNARANLLNENEVATIIRERGYRLWGNRTCSSDAKWAFLSVVRTADILNDSLLRSHLWAVDRNITKTYFEDVAEGVNAYIRELIGLGALLGGSCIPSPELNTAATLAAGRVYFDIDFTPPPPAERITFRSRLTNDYLDTILGAAEEADDTEEEAA